MSEARKERRKRESSRARSGTDTPAGSPTSAGTPSRRSHSAREEQLIEARKCFEDGVEILPAVLILPSSFSELNHTGQEVAMCTRSSNGILGFADPRRFGFTPTDGEKRLAEFGWRPIGRVWAPPTISRNTF